MDIKDLRKKLGIDDYLELVKEDRNCHGAYISFGQYMYLLEKENQELKNRLEECYCNRTDCSSRIKDSKQYDSLVQKTEKQQKEFIEYLEDEIYTIEPKGTLINFNCDYDSEEDYIRCVEKRVKLDTLKNNLSKYKEIIGGNNE